MKNLIIPALLMLLISACKQNNVAEPPPASTPSIEWQKCLGGSFIDIAHSVQQTSDGGYIVAGESNSVNGDVTGNHDMVGDAWIVKLTSDGAIQWQKCLGGSSGDAAIEIQQTSDGGYIVAGYSWSNDGDVIGSHGYQEYWVVKLSSGGATQWQKSLGGVNSEAAHSIQQTSDGGYIVAGISTSKDGDVTGNHGYVDYWVVKLSSGGAIEWQKSLGGSDDDWAYSIRQTSDGGYIVAGYSKSNDGDVTSNNSDENYWIVKLSSGGAIEWQKSLGGGRTDFAFSIDPTNDGGAIVAGRSKSNTGDVTGNHGKEDYWIVKLSSGGAIEWQKSLGGSSEDYAESIQQTKDGGYIVAGYSKSTDGDVTGNHGNWDSWIVKLSSGGAIEWQKSLGGSGTDQATSIQQTTDGSYIIAGLSDSMDGDVSGGNGLLYDYWVVKLKAP